MQRNIQYYLGENAAIEKGKVTFEIYDLKQIIEPGSHSTAVLAEADNIIALLLVALHKTTESPKSNDGTTPMIDAGQAVVSQISVPPSTSIVRNGSKQVEHKLNFNVYTSDYVVFPIDRIV